MVAMDTKFGRIYWVISDVRNFLYVQLQLPQHFTQRKKNLWHTKELMRVRMSQNSKLLVLKVFHYFLKFNHVIDFIILPQEKKFWSKILKF